MKDRGFLGHGLQALEGGLSCSVACGDLSSLPREQTVSPALEGEFLTTGPRRKVKDSVSCSVSFLCAVEFQKFCQAHSRALHTPTICPVTPKCHLEMCPVTPKCHLEMCSVTSKYFLLLSLWISFINSTLVFPWVPSQPYFRVKVGVAKQTLFCLLLSNVE